MSPDDIKRARELLQDPDAEDCERFASRYGAALLDLAEGHIQPHGEEFLEFKEALDDVRRVRAEYEDLNGGGPGWSLRNAAAWKRVDALFADEDEAAHDRQQEGFYG